MSSSLVGHRVRLNIADPWDFVTENGEWRTGTIVGEEAQFEGERPILRIDLDIAITASGLAMTTLFAAFRHAGSTEQDLLNGRLVPSNFSGNLGVGNQLSARPLAFIGGLQVLS